MSSPSKGRFPLLMRNDLRGFVGESEFTDIIYGYSVTDDIFFHSEKGAVVGPVKGPLGYYFYRLENRVPGPGVDIAVNDQQAFLVKDDLLGVSLLEFLSGLR